MSWIAKAKDVSSSNPHNSKLLHFQELTQGAMLEAVEPVKFDGPDMSKLDAMITALVDANAGLAQKVTTMIEAVQKHDPPPSKNPIYDAILALHDTKCMLKDITAIGGTDAGYMVRFVIHAVTNHQVDQLTHAHHDCKHINKMGPPS